MRRSVLAASDEPTARESAEIGEDLAPDRSGRDLNERLRRIVAEHRFETTQRVPFLCECDDPNCREIVMLSLIGYDLVREHPRRFLLAAGHVDAEAGHERILEAENGYAIIERVGPARG